MVKDELACRSLGGFIYQLAKKQQKMIKMEEIFTQRLSPKNMTFKDWCRLEGEYYFFSYNQLVSIAELLGYKQDPIHHESAWLTAMMKDYEKHKEGK